ncbi:MAG: hypothetical protein ACI7YS_17025 [Flavobacterium sp.]
MDLNISVCTVQFGNAPTNFQKNVLRSDNSGIESYDYMMARVSAIMNSKTKANHGLVEAVVKKIFWIAENPSKRFRRYTIGFHAHLMKNLRKILGYKLFNLLIRAYVLKRKNREIIAG